MNRSLFVLCIFVLFVRITPEDGVCDKNRLCTSQTSHFSAKYIFYDVNPAEGFNLRRDVYMRIAIMVKGLMNEHSGNWYLVLPPWPHLYHWQSDDIPNQERIQWSMFFDIASLAAFVPVMEMTDFFLTKMTDIDQVYVLQHFEDTFSSKNFEDRFKVEPCKHDLEYYRSDGSNYKGYFWGYNNMTSKKVQCLSFHGAASQLKHIILPSNRTSVMFDHAEVVLHDRFGDKTYWEARKSMVFSKHLKEEAVRFQVEHNLNGRSSSGGAYLCAHLRRRDFLRGRHKQVPSLVGAAKQISHQLTTLGLDTVFVATDAPQTEKTELKNYLWQYKVIYYQPSRTVKNRVKDGGVAIIDQIICSNARMFIGSHESTFSFRIHEEREIHGFSPETTFVRFCGDDEVNCKQPAQWRIVH